MRERGMEFPRNLLNSDIMRRIELNRSRETRIRTESIGLQKKKQKKIKKKRRERRERVRLRVRPDSVANPSGFACVSIVETRTIERRKKKKAGEANGSGKIP